jgi:hypothetical protein
MSFCADDVPKLYTREAWMSDADSVSRTLSGIREWNEFGERLNTILQEIKDKIGDAPLYVDEDGKFFVHPEVSRILNEPGNEGPLEFLRLMQRNGLGQNEEQ